MILFVRVKRVKRFAEAEDNIFINFTINNFLKIILSAIVAMHASRN